MPDDGRRYELVRGELRTMTPAGHPHRRIAWPLAQHVEERGLGIVYAAETGFLLARDPDTVRAPGAAFVRRERVEEVRGRMDTGLERLTWRSRWFLPATRTPK
jgi:Uma2 family endonuclease